MNQAAQTTTQTEKVLYTAKTHTTGGRGAKKALRNAVALCAFAGKFFS